MNVKRISVLIPAGEGRLPMLTEALGGLDAQTLSRDHHQTLMSRSRYSYPAKLHDLVVQAHGEWCIFHHDDDVMKPTYLERLHRAAHDHDADVVYTAVEVIGRYAQPHVSRPAWTLDNFKLAPVPWYMSLFRRRLWFETGGIDTRMAFGDWSFWYSCFKEGAKAIYIDEPLWRYRQHEGQVTRTLDSATERERLYARHPELRPT